MAAYRLSQIARNLNVGKNTIIEFLSNNGHKISSNPNTKITQEQYDLLASEYADAISEKEEASEITIHSRTENMVIKAGSAENTLKKEDDNTIFIKDNVISESEPLPKPEKIELNTKLSGPKIIKKIDLQTSKKEDSKIEGGKEETQTEHIQDHVQEEPPTKTESEPNEGDTEKLSVPEQNEEDSTEKSKTAIEKTDNKELIKGKAGSLRGLKVLDKIDLPPEPKPIASSDQSKKKRPRKRIENVSSQQRSKNFKENFKTVGRGGKRKTKEKIEELSDKEIQDKIKATLAKLSGSKTKVDRSKYRKEKRKNIKESELEEQKLMEKEEKNKIKLSEYISVNDLASLMNTSPNKVISACMSLGMFVSINQRLDAESIIVIADEFNYDVEFIQVKEDEIFSEREDEKKEDLQARIPIVTIMGHVDHGKTSLLDYIRNSKVTTQEAGGITQHIGAYDVTTDGGKRIAFLDTPGHEAFTAMRARGAKITDVAIIVIAADDSVMPQTKEAINHAQIANVPIVIAINKIDKPNANPDKLKEELSNMNILVEDWGGKYQCQHVSAKTGEGVDDLLEKVLLEAELLDLKTNPNKEAVGTVIEATLDKGRGHVTTLMVQSGTLKIGDIILAGSYYGKVKAMFDHMSKKLKTAEPSTPVQILGLDGAPQAGDTFRVMTSEKEAREITNKREQILREQSIRTKKHITLDEIGRRLAIGSFKELNIIVKGDTDGSIEALSDSLLKLSTEEVQVNILHKGVGQISESDVLLASASDAIIIGFEVRPSSGAVKLAETEQIEIRLYSIIYDAINEIKQAIEGMLEPTKEEVTTGTIEVREIFKISKVGTIAGCYVTNGKILRINKVRLVRNGIVVYTENINQLKRFKEDVNEVRNGFECGLSIKNFNDIKIGDVIEGFEIKEIKRTLS